MRIFPNIVLNLVFKATRLFFVNDTPHNGDTSFAMLRNEFLANSALHNILVLYLRNDFASHLNNMWDLCAQVLQQPLP